MLRRREAVGKARSEMGRGLVCGYPPPPTFFSVRNPEVSENETDRCGTVREMQKNTET